MSIRYDLYETPDIQQTGEQQSLHPRVVINGTVDQNEFLDRVHKFTGISRSLLSGAMQSFQNELRDLLANGWNVELGDIGYFSVSLQGPPIMKKEEVRAQSIKLKNINFRPSAQFKKEVGWQMRLERGESFTRPHGKGHSEEECLTIVNDHLGKYPCLTRADYCRLTGHDKQRALNELNAFIELRPNEIAHQSHGIATCELFLGLALKLGIEHLGRQHETGAACDVVGQKLHALGHQAVRVHKGLERQKQTLAKTSFVRAAGGSRNQIYVALAHGCAGFAPAHNPVGTLVHGKRLIVFFSPPLRFERIKKKRLGEFGQQIFSQTSVVAPGQFLPRLFVEDRKSVV